MPLTSNDPARERILSMGLWGAGKTHSHCVIGKWYRDTDTPGTFYVLDTDNTTLRSLTAFENWEANTKRVDVWDWEQLMASTTEWFGEAGPDDWLCVDSIDKPWSMVQDYFIEQQFGVDATDFFVQARKANQQGHALASDYGSNWTVIDKFYQKWIGMIIRWPGHVYAASPAQQVQQPNQQGKGGDSREVRETFGRYGVRPSGQKNLGFQFHTVLLLQSPSKDEYTVTSVKDRSRELLLNAPMADFAVQYLCGTRAVDPDMIHTCPCGQPAVIRAEQVVNSTVPDEEGVLSGGWLPSWWCQEHAELLIRTTPDRYRLVHLVPTPRTNKKVKGQMQWELD